MVLEGNELRTNTLSSVKLRAGPGRFVRLIVKYPEPEFAGSPKSCVTVTEVVARISPDAANTVSTYVAVPCSAGVTRSERPETGLVKFASTGPKLVWPASAAWP